MIVIQKVFETLNLKVAYSLGMLDAKHNLIQLNREEDYHRLWLQEHCYIYMAPIHVFKWTPDNKVSEESLIVPIWISLPSLPILFLSKNTLFSIAQLIGKPLKIDSPTTGLRRPCVACVCREIDILKELPRRIWVGCIDKVFAISYKNMLLYCNHCLRLGHSAHTA